MKLKGKVCVITGSSRGIGAAIAERYAAEGAAVVITYLTSEDLALAVSKRCPKSIVCQLDVRSRDSIRQMVSQVVTLHGHIDVLVNNAGINCPNDFLLQTETEWDEVLAVDLKGVFLCCQEVLPYMPNGGRVINIGSLSGEYGGPRTPSYAAAKAGVMALTHCLARFLGDRNISVNCLSPGPVDNSLTAATMSSDVRNLLSHTLLLKRFASESEIAGPAVFLASEDASYITGQTFGVNGGAWVR